MSNCVFKEKTLSIQEVSELRGRLKYRGRIQDGGGLEESHLSYYRTLLFGATTLRILHYWQCQRGAAKRHRKIITEIVSEKSLLPKTKKFAPIGEARSEWYITCGKVAGKKIISAHFFTLPAQWYFFKLWHLHFNTVAPLPNYFFSTVKTSTANQFSKFFYILLHSSRGGGSGESDGIPNFRWSHLLTLPHNLSFFLQLQISD